MTLIQEHEYYRRSADGFEAMQETIRSVQGSLSADRQARSFLKKCLEGSKAHDTIALLAFAKTTTDGDELSPEVLQLWQRHEMRGHLTGIAGWTNVLLAEQPDNQFGRLLVSAVTRATKFMDTMDERTEKQKLLSTESPGRNA